MPERKEQNMFGLTKTAISAMPILGFVADFWETEQFGSGKLPIFRFRHCRFYCLSVILNQRQNRGQIVLDNILFARKTAPWSKLLIINNYLFAIKLSNGFYASQLYPFRKQLNQIQEAFSMCKKCTLISTKWKQLK